MPRFRLAVTEDILKNWSEYLRLPEASGPRPACQLCEIQLRERELLPFLYMAALPTFQAITPEKDRHCVVNLIAAKHKAVLEVCLLLDRHNDSEHAATT